MSRNPMSEKPMSKNPMSRQNEWIERMIQRAEADEPVYITDVREAFDRYGKRAFHIHAFLYEGGRERFPLSLPEWENDRQRSFTAEYVRAFLYNLLSTLGALKIEIYLFFAVPTAEKAEKDGLLAVLSEINEN